MKAVEVYGNSSLKNDAPPYIIRTSTYKTILVHSLGRGEISLPYHHIGVNNFFIPKKQSSE